MLRASGSSVLAPCCWESRNGAICRASPSAADRDSRSGLPSRDVAVPRTRSRPVPSPASRQSSQRPASRGTVPDRSTTVVPSRPGPVSAQVAETSPPSSTTTTCGAVVSGFASGANRGRPPRSWASAVSASSSAANTIRRAPAASVRPGCWACGSHFTQSQTGCRSGAATTTTSRSSGAWNVTSWPSAARARSSTGSRSPRNAIRLNARSDNAVGRSGTLEWARTNRRSAIALIGSRSSTGLVSGGTISTASRCGPSAIRTSPKSSSVIRRSHSRREAAIDQSASGSGCRQVIAARCCSAARRVRLRICAR